MKSLLDAGDSLLLLIDTQERLAPVIAGVEEVLESCRRLIAGARAVEVPVLATEHFPRGLGGTVAPVRELLAEGEIMEKIHFSAAFEAPFRDRIAEIGRRQIVVAGTESHVCVLQTALGLKDLGYQVFVVADAVGSRDPENKRLALDRLRDEGLRVVAREMVLFEWAKRGASPAFRKLLPLIK